MRQEQAAAMPQAPQVGTAIHALNSAQSYNCELFSSLLSFDRRAHHILVPDDNSKQAFEMGGEQPNVYVTLTDLLPTVL
mgnify:FL=1